MKFGLGDCISIRIENGSYLAGFIISTRRGMYEFAFSDYCSLSPPSPEYFKNCYLFSVYYSMGENSFSSLDLVMIVYEFMDLSSDIQLITYIDLPEFLPASGFEEKNSISGLKNYFESGLSVRKNETKENAGAIPEIGSKGFVNSKQFLESIPPSNEFPTAKLYKTIDNTLHYFQVYGNSSNPFFLVNSW